MDENEAERVASELDRLGLRGVASPADAENPDGEWRVFDSADPATRRDITEEAEAAVARAVRPTRGFVLPASP
ncbi:hypothetical protein ACGFX4_31660 [Kitasatospora sp. NPDC048365]|uniref:hypothetical protein n=1 Tax=Kitasatospora sp. NPDC048365 TaxID=3364050 RepID=UPI0037248D3E